MMYLNGEIKAVYLGGHYHSEAYLGSTLVWSTAKKVPGEAHEQLAFQNTADGVMVMVLPGQAEEVLTLAANLMAETNDITDGSANELMTLLTTAESTAAETPNAAALESLLLQCTVFGKDIIINKQHIEKQLKFITSVPQTVTLGLIHAGTVGDGLTMETTTPPVVAATLVDNEASLSLQLEQTTSVGDTVLFVNGQLDSGEVLASAADGAVVGGANGAVESKFTIGSVTQPETLIMSGGQSNSQLTAETQIQPEILGVVPQEAIDNLKLHFATEWTLGVGEKSSEDCEITAQAIGHAQMEGAVPIGAEGNQMLQLTARVIGTAGEPVFEKTRAAQYIEGTLEEINLDDWPNGITTIPANTIILQRGLKNVAIPASVRVIEEVMLDSCHVEAVTFGAVSALTVNNGFTENITALAMKLSDDDFDLDFPEVFDNTVVDFSALTFVPTFVPDKNSDSTTINAFTLAKEIRVKKSLVNGWKNLSTLTDNIKNKIVGV